MNANGHQWALKQREPVSFFEQALQSHEKEEQVPLHPSLIRVDSRFIRGYTEGMSPL